MPRVAAKPKPAPIDPAIARIVDAFAKQCAAEDHAKEGNQK